MDDAQPFFTPVVLASKFSKHEMLVWRLNDRADRCFVFEFQRDLKNGLSATYRCKGCYQMKQKNGKLGPFPSIKVHKATNNIHDDPERPKLPHYCTPFKAADWLAKGILREEKKDLLVTPALKPAISRKRIIEKAALHYGNEDQTIKEDIFNTLEGKPNSKRRFFSRANNRVAIDVELGFIDPQLFDSFIDDESYALLDDGDHVIFGSMRNAHRIFTELQVSALHADRRYKRLPKIGNSSQIYSIIASLSTGHTLPLLFAYIPNRKKETFTVIFGSLKKLFEDAGILQIVQQSGVYFVFDFELTAIKAQEEVLDLPVKGCTCHYHHAIQVKIPNVLKISKNEDIQKYLRRLEVIYFLPIEYRDPFYKVVQNQSFLATEVAALQEFGEYYDANWAWPAGDKSVYLHHDRSLGPRINNSVKGNHTRVRNQLEKVPTLQEILGLWKDEVDKAKANITGIKNGTIPREDTTKQEVQRQDDIERLIYDFGKLQNPISYEDCCDFLDRLYCLVAPKD